MKLVQPSSRSSFAGTAPPPSLAFATRFLGFRLFPLGLILLLFFVQSHHAAAIDLPVSAASNASSGNSSTVQGLLPGTPALVKTDVVHLKGGGTLPRRSILPWLTGSWSKSKDSDAASDFTLTSSPPPPSLGNETLPSGSSSPPAITTAIAGSHETVSEDLGRLSEIAVKAGTDSDSSRDDDDDEQPTKQAPPETSSKSAWSAASVVDGENSLLPLLLDGEDGGMFLSKKNEADKNKEQAKKAEALEEEEEANAASIHAEQDPGHYEGDLSNREVEQRKEDEKREDVGEMIDHILDRLEEGEDKGAGRFNQTLEKQEAVLEWVARVGKVPQNTGEEEGEGENGEGKTFLKGASGNAGVGGAGDTAAGGVVGQGKEEGKDGGNKGDVKGEIGGGQGDSSKEKGGDGKKTMPSEGGGGDETGKKELPWLEKMLGVGGGVGTTGTSEVPVETAAEKEKEARRKNSTIINAQSSSNYRSEAEVKEMSETQAKEKAEKAAKEEKREEALKEEKKKEKASSEDVPRLIDSNDNVYVMSNPGKGSKMQLQEDLTLISDIVKVIVAAAIGGLICGMLGQPLILGYLAAGMIVGPGGFKLIHELVQVETLAQFGVVFLLFALGIEFNVAHMKGCQTVALGGGALQILVAMTVGGLFATQATQGIFIGAFLSMSSTAVVLKCLMDSNSSNTEHGQIMLGTLILQDCALGLLLAVMPALAAKGSSVFTIGKTLLWEVTLLFGFCFLAWILSKTFIPRFLNTLVRLSRHSGELYQLGCIGVCLCVALCSEHLGLSLEVGAFLAGLMLSGGKHSERSLHQIEPIRNIFAALFLASIGMVMHPVFLWQHKDILLTALFVVFFGKACLIALTVRLFGYSARTAISVGIALAQIGEFSFVLLSRALVLNLVSHKLYLLLMGTTALSLVLTPFAFKVVPYIAAASPDNERMKESPKERKERGWWFMRGFGRTPGSGGGGGGGGSHGHGALNETLPLLPMSTPPRLGRASDPGVGYHGGIGDDLVSGTSPIPMGLTNNHRETEMRSYKRKGHNLQENVGGGGGGGNGSGGGALTDSDEERGFDKRVPRTHSSGVTNSPWGREANGSTSSPLLSPQGGDLSREEDLREMTPSAARVMMRRPVGGGARGKGEGRNGTS
eukprot:TRINITY_DN2193_c0_g1_i1.p1 TRINITY_DN2193_c0_g1~~TRINITY_DN2193_c0_g1_i1.p1  ORF type:complete len:1138 (-),score=257.41 TRINITY_DN2193_c0_g1_i1:396-3809(-)